MPKKNSETKQLEILRYIYDTVEHRGFPPTVREICTAVNLSSTSTVHGHLARLERKGLLIKDATKPRALEITLKVKMPLALSQRKFQLSAWLPQVNQSLQYRTLMNTSHFHQIWKMMLVNSSCLRFTVKV